MVSSEYEKLLNITKEDIKKFRCFHIKQKKFNVGISVKNITEETLDILSDIEELQLYSFEKIQTEKNIINLEDYCQNLKDTVIAIKNMNLLISDDMRLIKLAQNINKETFALINIPVEIKNKCIKQFLFRPENLEKTIVKIKKDIKNSIINQRENYLKSLINRLKQEKKYKEIKKTSKEKICLILKELFKVSGKRKYLNLYLKNLKALLKTDFENFNYLTSYASELSLNTNNKTEALKFWKKLFKYKGHETLHNYALFQYRNGNFKEYLENYFYKLYKNNKYIIVKDFNKPVWKGEKDVADKTLVVHYELGFGDIIYFSRYIHKVKDLFKKIYFVVPDELYSLLKNNFTDIEFCSQNDFNNGLINFDYFVPLIYIQKALNLTPKNYKKQNWIKAEKNKVKEFKKYFDKNFYNIGVFWDSQKSLTIRKSDLETFMPLAKLKNVKLYSLHINKKDVELNYLDDSVEIINLGKHFKDFSDTAGAIENCDLVVTTDSSVLNLAGAMGKKTFGLFPQYADWRWYKLDGEDVGYYKSVKPFQAKRQNNFKPVIKQICKEVKKLVKQKLSE